MGRSNTATDVFRFIDTNDNDPNVCWPWTGSVGGRDGRGYITIDGKKQLAHRVVYTIFKGEIAEDMVIRHRCNNPICCNPTHLLIGTRGQNEDDKYDSDRAGYTHDMIKEMRRYNKLGMTYVAIAKEINRKFNTSISANGVGRVIRGERRNKQELRDDNETV